MEQDCTPGCGYGALATLGYIYDYGTATAGRHTIAIRKDVNDEKNQDHVTMLAHEIGHVLGLAHEHQRVDREFHCFLFLLKGLN